MDCPDCGRTNRTGAKFCAGCATPLIAACTACGHQLAPDARFCDECGHPVGGPAPPRTESEAIRKTVTVMFCDLVGSTSFGERVDTESVRETLGRYHSMVQRMVDDRGGTVAKFIGDGVMNVFGVPEVAEDDAERAVATGLELQRGFAAIRSVVKDRFGIDLGMRVGINTGEVIISDDDSDLVGDVLNTAARLEAACEPGSVLVGEDTWRLTRSTIRYETLGEIELKGKSDGVAAFRAVDEAAVDNDSTTPFVGRDAELRALLAIIDEAVASREVRLATVIGAPGVGKTRLAEELQKTYVGDATFVDIRIERTGGTTFSPIAELLRIAAGLDDARSHGEVLERIRALVGNLDDAERVASLLASFVGAAEMRSTEELFFAVRRMLEAVGQTRSIVVVVDDIQWAEPLLLDLLEHLAEWVHDAPAVMLALARPELRELRPALAERGRRVSESISLEGLDAEATAELAARLVGATALPTELLDRLPESTEGNPLFVRELMRMLIDDKVIVEGDQGWELAIDAEAVEVPPTIQSLLSSRIERLPGNERRMLERASVVGADFPLGAVAALTPQGDAGRLIPILERLRRKELVEPTGAYWGNEPIFRFHHALIRDASYRRLLKRTRADHHLTVATWMTGSGGDVTGEHEVAIGYHLEQAHDLRIQLNIHDDDTAEIGARAAETLRAAAERALERDDVAAASSLAARAVALLDQESPELPDLLMLGCEAFFAFGDVSAGLPLLTQLEDRTGDDERLSAWVYAFRAQLRMLTEPDRLVEAEVAAATAAEALAMLDDRTGEANARLVRAGALARLGHIGDCEAELDKALTAARAADDGRRVATILGAAPVAALWGPSPVPRAGGRCLDVLRLLRITTGSPRVEATSTRCQAVLEALRGRFDTARSMLADTRTSVEKLGDRHGLLETQLYWGIVELLAGEPEAAEPHLRAAYGGLGRLGIGADAGQAAAHLSRALMLQGRLDEAAELAADSEALAGQNPQTAIAAKAARADLLAEQGDLDEARQVAETAVAIAEGTDILVDHANANLVLARVCSMAGDADGTRAAVDEAQRLFDAKGASVTVDIQVPNEPDPTPIAGTELFDADDLDEATRRVEELTAESADEDGEPSITRGASAEPWNRADMIARGYVDALVRRDLAAAMAVLHDEVTLEDLRPGVRSTLHGRSDAADHIRTAGEMAEPTDPDRMTIDLETLATRGDDLVLHQAAVGPDDSSVGNPHYQVVQLVGDRIQRLVTFGVAELGRAVQELDRLYLETADDPAERWLVLECRMLYSEVSGRQRDETGSPSMVSFLDDDYVQHDHRSLGWGVRDRAGHAERVESLIVDRSDVTAYLARIFECRGVASRIEAHITVTAPDQATVTDVQHMVNEVDPGTGMLIRTDRFGDDQMEAARQRWEELEARTRDVLANVASFCGGSADTWARRGDWSHFESAIAESLTVEDANGTALIDPDHPAPELAGDLGFGARSRRVLAVRGEHLALVLHTNENSQVLRLEEVDDHCRLCRITLLEPRQLADAVRQLERRWVEIGQPAEADMLSILRNVFYPADTERGAGWIGLHTEDFRLTDHRAMGYGSGDREWHQNVATSRDQSAVVLAPVIWERNEHGILTPLEGWYVTEAGTLEVAAPAPAIGISVVRDGRLSAIEVFESDDGDAARRRFEELTDPPSELRSEGDRGDEVPVETERPDLGNRASHVANRAHTLHRDRRWDLIRMSLAPVVRVTGPDGDSETVERGKLLDRAIARRFGFGAAHRRVLAVRGEHLVLMEWAWEADSGAPDRCFAVVELDELARLSEVRSFDWDVDSLTDATDLLEARWMETGDLDDIDVSTIEAIAAWRHGDGATLQRILHEDFQVVDHRLFSWGDYTKETFISLFDIEARNVVVEVPAIYLGGSGSGRVYQLTAWGFSDDEMIEALHGHFVIVHRDGQVLRCDGHEIDTPDESIARLHELQVELGDVVEEGEEASEGDRPWNRADALSRELLGFMAVGEVDEHRLLLAEDVVLDDRRTGIASRIVGRVDAVTVTMPGVYSDDVEVVLDIEPVAARQDDLVLHHCTIRQADGHGAHMEWLNVSSWRDGQLELALQLDPHDYPAAVTELDRLFLERAHDPAVHRRVRAWAASLGAISRGDVAGGTAYGDEGFEWIDHRPIGWGVPDQDGMDDRFTSRKELPERRVAYVARFGEAEGPVEWVESHLRVSGRDGSDQVDVQVLVNALDPSSGLMLRTHQYATDQVSEATEKFAELADSARSRGDLWNAAVAVGGSVSSWIRRADMKRVRSWISPDLSLVDVKGNRHRLQTIDIEERSALRRHGLGLDHRRVLAIRGERLALTELRDGDASPSIHHLAIEEVGADARLVSITLFTPDSLADAVRHLERQWLTIETPGTAEVLDLHARLVHAYSVNDGAALESILTSDATFTDHRELGFGHVDRDWILESSELNHAVATAPVDARYLEWNEHGVLGWMLPWQLEEDGRLVQAGVSAYSIMHVVDGRVAAVEFLPDGRLDAARTRFDELTSPTGSSGNPSSKPSWGPADPDRP